MKENETQVVDTKVKTGGYGYLILVVILTLFIAYVLMFVDDETVNKYLDSAKTFIVDKYHEVIKK